MIVKFMILAVIFTAVNAEILNANDAQTCVNLCTSCQGTASFVDGYCECYVPAGSEQGECITRIKRQANDLGMDFMDCEAATAERPARCNLRSHHLRATDGDRIAKYFMRGGPVVGSPMIQSQCGTDNVVSAPNPQPQTQPESVGCPDSQLSFTPSSDSIVGAPLVPYNLQRPLYRQSLKAPQPHHWPTLAPSMPLRFTPISSPVYFPVQSPLHYSFLPPLHSSLHSPVQSSLHYPFITSLHSPLRHPMLGASQMEEPEENIVGATHKSYIPPIQMIKERPHMIAAPTPIIQPGYSYQSKAAVPLSKDLLTLLKETLMHQNAILEAIQRHLNSADANVGTSRVLYTSEEPKLGASPPKFCPEPIKVEEPVVGSPKKTDCNKQRITRMSPAIEALIEGIPKIQKIKEMEQLEKTDDFGNEQLARIDKWRRDETSDRPLKEARPNLNGRQRKRELKKASESKSP
ncbi:uncharacterized protein LOC135172672 isoform X2 [Diachasmimorpha longicaudata]|uniref:uncharacterized protein LOC135172672 isoform X2 n=1 Tax=Diachasmimorpha longicaudata TaxID=58733 RepID=UPI0030B91618